jgi:O-methyltransferase involved in polyketide biosynthesis
MIKSFKSFTMTTVLDVPPARVSTIYHYCLTGHPCSPVDKQVGDSIIEEWSGIVDLCKANLDFRDQFLSYAIQHGITQFIDLGAGLPLTDRKNVHDIVQEINPRVKVAYIDIDTSVQHVWDRVLQAQPFSAIISGDIRNVEDVLLSLERHIDFKEPVGILMMCLTCFLKDDELATVLQAVHSRIRPGSYIAISQDTLDSRPGIEMPTVQKAYRDAGMELIFRSYDEVTKMFNGLELIEPGVVKPQEWQLHSREIAQGGDTATTDWLYVGVGRTRE